ncbi:MAG: NADH-quinone oxidoreductase subunit N [Fimbriimonadales bacterium]
MFNFPVPTIDFPAILPMVVVMVTGVLALIAELIWYKRNNAPVIAVSLIGLAAAAGLLLQQWGDAPRQAIANTVVVDAFGLSVQFLLVISCALALLFSEGYLREKRIPFGEFYPLALWSTGGAMLMATSKNLLVIFLGLEVLSIALYVMAGMSRSEERSEESALKYFLLGSFASGFLLYGIAFIYGATGSLHLDTISMTWQTAIETKPMLLFGLGLMLIGLSFKSSFVPFHQWTPDVYQGAPTNVTAFMAAVSKIAAIATLARVLEGMFLLREFWIPALSVIAILTMTVGNLVALAQKDVKRILGYSGIAHAGYLLVGLLAHFRAPERGGLGPVTFYLLSYSLMTIGAFAVISMVAKGGKEGTRLADLHGLWKRQPLAAGALILFVASLIGIPATAGFAGKFQIFLGAIDANLTTLAVVLALNSVLSIAYYLQIGVAAFVSEEDEGAGSATLNPGLRSTLTLCAAGVLAVGILVSPVLNWLVHGSETTSVSAARTPVETSQPVALNGETR